MELFLVRIWTLFTQCDLLLNLNLYVYLYINIYIHNYVFFIVYIETQPCKLT